jgi:hypothetical protein
MARVSEGSAWRRRNWRVWAGSRIAAVILGAILVWALFQLTPIQPLPEAPAVQAVVVSALEVPRPPVIPPPVATKTPERLEPQKPAAARAPDPVKSDAQALKLPAIVDRPTPNIGATTPRLSPSAAQVQAPTVSPRIATAPATQGGGAAAGAGTQGITGPRAMSSGLRAILRAQECARLDMNERPPDCPPNAEILQMLAKARGPNYRPENAEAFSANEKQWRGIPPPCLPDGSNGAVNGTSVCIRVGNVPSRVRSVREICEARGLGGCADAPAQAAVNAAIEQVKRSKAPN